VALLPPARNRGLGGRALHRRTPVDAALVGGAALRGAPPRSSRRRL